MRALLRHPLLLLLLLQCTSHLPCVSAGGPQRYLEHVSVGGCPLLVRGQKVKGGLSLILDPVLCITSSLDAVQSHYDPISKQNYVSLPVMLRDEALLDRVALQLRRLTPASVTFAPVSELSATADPGSVFAAVAFVWSPGESVAYLRIGCNSSSADCKIDTLRSNLRASNFEALDRVLVSATLTLDGGTRVTLDYRLAVKSSGESSVQVSDYSVSSRGTDLMPTCKQLLPVRTVSVGNCTAHVFRQLDGGKASFLVEPLICFIGGGVLSSGPDYSRDRSRLTLSLKLQDASSLAKVKEQLTDLEPTSVTFMRLWRASHEVSPFLAGRYGIGPLMGPTDGSGLGLVHVHCTHAVSCRYLLSQISANPVNFWRHIRWRTTSLVPDSGCAHAADGPRFSVLMKDADADAGAEGWEAVAWREACPRLAPCQYSVEPDGRHFIVIQQRMLGTTDFTRTWADYEKGFGDATDFWIGLTAIHLLSSHGTTLRVEMDLWNGTHMFSEYSKFSVGDASTNYRMTYREMTRSSVTFDAMATSNGMQFATLDRDNDKDVGSCSLTWGRGGWWFNACYKLYPNGLFPTTVTKDWKYTMWASDSEVVPLKRVRMKLQV